MVARSMQLMQFCTGNTNKELENYSHIKMVVYSSRCPKKKRMLLEVKGSRKKNGYFTVRLTVRDAVKNVLAEFVR